MIDQCEMTRMLGGGGGAGPDARLRLDVLRRQPEPGHIFGLGIMPYISASIIFQLLASVYPPLEKLQKEGESGRKKINEYTRYATVVICLFQAYMYVSYVMSNGKTGAMAWAMPGYNTTFCLADHGHHHDGRHHVPDVARRADRRIRHRQRHQPHHHGRHRRPHPGTRPLTCSSRMASFNCESRLHARRQRTAATSVSKSSIVLMLLFVGVVVGVIAITKAQRRIPTQSAKHVRGRRVFGGTRQFLPLQGQSGGRHAGDLRQQLLVVPVLLFSAARHQFLALGAVAAARRFERQGYIYNVCYIVADLFLLLLLDGDQLQSEGMANNLKDYGSFIPGYRPGKRTAEYLERVMMRITYVGAAFLAVVAVIPTLITQHAGRQLQRRQLLRRHGPADRRQRGPRSGAEDQ